MIYDKAYFEDIFDKCIDPFIDNIREVNRICNAVSFKLNSIYKEINFVDLITISVIEICCPKIYEWIRDNKDILTESTYYAMMATTKSQEEWGRHYEGIIQNDLDVSNIKKAKSEVIMRCISYLFPAFGRIVGMTFEMLDYKELRLKNRIGSPIKFDVYFHLDINGIVIARNKIESAIFNMDIDELKRFLVEIRESDKLDYFWDELNCLIQKINCNRAEIIVKILFDETYNLEDKKKGMWISLESSKSVLILIPQLIDRIENDKRYLYLKNTIFNANADCISCISDFLINIKNIFGKKDKSEKNQLISLEQLENLEGYYCNRVKELLKEHNILDFKNPKNIVYLIESLDPVFCREYFDDNFLMPINILKVLTLSSYEWAGDGFGWEYTEEYKKYFTDQEAFSAISETLKDRSFWELSTEIQKRVVAFYIIKNENFNHHDKVSQSDVEEILNEWKIN